MPFLLKGVARPARMPSSGSRADRIHPIADAHPIILGNIWPALKPLLR